MRYIQTKFKGNTKYDLTNIAIKAKISEGKLFVLKKCAKDSKKELDVDKFSLNLLPDGVKA